MTQCCHCNLDHQPSSTIIDHQPIVDHRHQALSLRPALPSCCRSCLICYFWVGCNATDQQSCRCGSNASEPKDQNIPGDIRKEIWFRKLNKFKNTKLCLPGKSFFTLVTTKQILEHILCATWTCGIDRAGVSSSPFSSMTRSAFLYAYVRKYMHTCTCLHAPAHACTCLHIPAHTCTCIIKINKTCY